MKNILEQLHNETKKNIYQDFDEYMHPLNSFSFYELYSNNEKVRILISDIDKMIRQDTTPGKSCILEGTISFIESTWQQMQGYIASSPSKEESIKEIFLNSIIESVSFFSNVNIDKIFLTKMFDAIVNKNLKQFIFEINELK